MALKYVMRCVNESMRLYPHPPVLLRRAMVQDELPGGLRAGCKCRVLGCERGAGAQLRKQEARLRLVQARRRSRRAPCWHLASPCPLPPPLRLARPQAASRCRAART